MIEYRKFTEFPRGTLYDILQDAYSFDARNKRIWDANWHESDDFFYDNPNIADNYGLVTCIDNMPIGFVTWDPRHRPEYVEIGHNGIREKYKGNGYGRMQLEEAIRRIKEYEGLQRIIVCTNSNLVAPKNYESVGFKLYDRKENHTESEYTGDYLYYEIVLRFDHEIVAMNVTDTGVLQLFSEHDDYMIDFLGDDSGYYARYSEKENIGKVWVVCVDNRPIGCIAYRQKADGIGEVKRLFVKKEYRGKGLAKELLRTVECHAREQRCRTLYLDTRITLEPAVSLYRDFGFEIIIQHGLYIQMEKKL